MKSRVQIRSLLARVMVLLLLASSTTAGVAELCSLLCSSPETQRSHDCCAHGSRAGRPAERSMERLACSHGAAPEQQSVIATNPSDPSAQTDGAQPPAALAFLAIANAPGATASMRDYVGSHAPPGQTFTLPLRI